jgi:exonuclease SbcC
MIKYNYLIIQDEGNEKVSYKRKNFPEKLPNAVYMEGRNSIGKSTLLNIIALAFFGEKKSKEELSDTLRDQLINLISKDQQITFDIEIKNDVIKQSLIARKKDLKSPHIERRIVIDGKEKPLTDQYFQQNYNLIYDIPDNPRERLNELLDEIKVDQSYYANEVGKLQNYVRDVQRQIDEQRTPEKEKELSKDLAKCQKKSEGIEKDLEKIEKDLKDTKIYGYCRMYNSHRDRLQRIENEYKKAKKASQDITKTEKQQSKKQSDLLKEIQKNSNTSKKLFDDATELLVLLTPKTEKHHLEIWKSCTVTNEIQKSDQIETIRQEIKFFKSILPTLITSDDSKKIEHINVLKDFLDLFNHYASVKMNLPGANKTIQEIASSISNEIRTYGDITSRRDNINDCNTILGDLRTSMNDAIKSKNEYNKLLKKHGITLEKNDETISDDELLEYEKNKEDTKKRMEYYEKELNKLDITKGRVEGQFAKILKKPHISVLTQLTDNQIIDKIHQLGESIRKKNTDLKSAQRSLNYVTEEITRFEESDEHPYLDYKDRLGKILKSILTLEQKLGTDFDKRIESLKQKDLGKSKDDKKYADQVSNFLATKVPYIRHGENQHTVKQIDMINNEVITKKGKKIKFSKMGTGQSQSAYLTGRLNTSDDRKIIALFDEVAALDSSSLKPIKDGFKKLYNAGKLFSGIIVQKHDDKESIEDLT